MPHASSKWLGKNIPNDYETNHNVTTINIIALENNSTINETLAAVKLRGFFIFKYLPVALLIMEPMENSQNEN